MKHECSINDNWCSKHNHVYLCNVQKITSADDLRSRAFDDEQNINCNRKIAEFIFLTLLKSEFLEPP